VSAARIFRSLKINRAGQIGTALLLLIVCTAVFAPWLASHDPYERVGPPFQNPSPQHPLGTNDIGQDILSEIIWGTRVSLTIGFFAAAIALFLGTLIGIVSGYYRRWLDPLFMRLADVVLVIPFLPLMILLAAYLGPRMSNIVMVIGLLTWAGPARVIRSQVLSLREYGYVQAARSLGGTDARIMFRHILPGVFPMALAQFIRAVSSAVLIESSLAFLGLGDPTAKSWGMVLYYAQARGAFLTGAWVWWILPPGLLITFTVLAFALTGYALEELVNPRLRGR
jgi:ABC-type dipeptide/oligopeptide/nickel transport system permease subunit